ncbi:MAG: SpoIIE family protein phosphatase [candidate division Zixibacteria bacterium]|nr:SpoIIE family protein phosphatase [candidate division Zixibacteria bacterium]
MWRRPVKEITAEFIAEEKYLDSLQRTARESCVAAGMSSRDVNAVLLATEEGATNIIRHAYLYEKGTIRLRIVIYRKLIVLSLIDTGRSFQASEKGTIDLEHLVESGRKGGLGFYMIGKIMDSVEYISSAGYNELRMIKRIRPSSAGSVPLLRRMTGLRVKFSVWTTMIVLIILAGSAIYVDDRISRQVQSHLDETVASLGSTIAAQAAGYTINRRSDAEFDELVVSYAKSNSEFLRLVVITSPAGNIVAHSDDIHNIRKGYSFPDGIDKNDQSTPQRLIVDGADLFYLMVPIVTNTGMAGMVHITYSAAYIEGELAQSREDAVLLTLVLLLFGVLGVYLLSSYFVDPIVKITQRVRRLASGDLTTELPLEGAEEFFEISKAFNVLMTRVSQDRENIVAREKMAKEIEVASHIQKTLLPNKLPNLPGLELNTFYRAAEVIGGDLYDVFETDPGRYCLVVADVSGKGVPASLVMSMLRTVIQIHAAHEASAKVTLIKVNDYLRHNIPPGMFITVMLAMYDTAQRKLDFVSAGHNPMLLYRRSSSTIETLNPTGMPVGMPVTLEFSFEDRLEEVSLELEDGDFFFMFTDGVTEASNRDGETYGLDRLTKLFEEQLNGGDATLTTTILGKSLLDALDDFAGFTKPSDDITFVLARSCSPDDGMTETKSVTEDE